MDQTPSNSIQQITKQEFNNKYWFTSLQMVTVKNPLDEDWPFMVELRHFFIGAGKNERFPGVIANVYLDGMSKIMAQRDDKLAYMTDPSLQKIYYDQLIVDVENLAPEYDNTPAYLKNVAPSAQGTPPPAANETPPWDASQGERARDVVPNVPEHTSVVDEPKVEEKPTDKEFELDGVKYKLTVDKNDKKMYFKAGKLCSAADYNKAASLL